MSIRLMVFTSLLGACVIAVSALAGAAQLQVPRSVADEVVAAGYSAADDDVVPSPPLEEQPTTPERSTMESLETSAMADDPGYGWATAGCDACPPSTCCPSVSCCPSPNVWTERDFIHRNSFYAQGWLDQGFTWNPDSPADRFNRPLTFNDRANEYQMNQLYLIMGRRADSDPCRFGFGGRVDLLYGSDYYFTSATGLETHDDGTQHWNSTGPRAGGTAALYGLSMPQLYAEFYLPWRYGTMVKVGHFETILGYESLMAPENFFYSHSYVMQYGEPKTYTGMLASYQFAPRLALQAGLTRGWDSWEDPTDRVGFLGGVSWKSRNGRTNVNLAVSTGDEEVIGQHNRTVYSLVLMQQLSSRWRYVFQNDYGIQDAGAFGAQLQLRPARWYGINQYLFYSMSDEASLGFRFEWFRDEQNSRVLGVPITDAATGGNYYEATFGFNWRPSPRFTLRPEVRWDWSDVVPAGDSGMYNDFTDKNQFTFATDLIFVF